MGSPNANFINIQDDSDQLLKGGIFFGSLAAGAAFSNIPKFLTINIPTTASANTVYTTLQNIKDSLKNKLESEYNYTQEQLDNNDQLVESFLYDFTSLLIDYGDLRNYIFFGSAYIETAYSIKDIITNFPFQTGISDNASGFTSLVINNNNDNNTTDLIFNESNIFDIGNFTLFDEDNNAFNFSNYQIVDNNGTRYNIVNGILPYGSSSIKDIINIIDGVAGIGIYSNNHGFINGQVIEIYEVVGTLYTGQTLINVNKDQNVNGSEFIQRFVVTNAITNYFELLELNTGLPTLMNFDYVSGGVVRLYPLSLNSRPYTFKITIDGILTSEQLITYTEATTNINKLAFLISPQLSVINDFYFNISPIESFLLAPAPVNQTPWPLKPVTNNIQYVVDTDNPDNNDIEFVQWLQNPNLLYEADGTEADNDVAPAGNSICEQYNALRASALDETYSNQLLRRCLPAEIIDQYDTESYFQKFILIAGWMFDQLYVYTKFIKYLHTLNYTNYNQLSPSYYRTWADHYGFDLFDDNSIDFSDLVITTEPGLKYIQQSVDTSNQYYRYTLQELEYEREKRLLISLFYLYRIKGTQNSITQLVSLLGAPDGLLQISEYVSQFNYTDGLGHATDTSMSKYIDNEKVYVPDFHFEIDPDYLIDKVNINSNVNKPYVYKLICHNDTTINLREIGIETDPNAAIDDFLIENYGTQEFNYLKFNTGEFANLQNINSNCYYLPFQLPNKFNGISVDYMIPRDGYIKTDGNNQEETSIILCGLNLIGNLSMPSQLSINNIVLSSSNQVATITTTTNHYFILNDKVNIEVVNGISNITGNFIVTKVIDNFNIQITGNFTGTYINGGTIVRTTPNLLPSGFNYSYPIPENYSNYNYNASNPDSNFNLLYQYFNSSTYISQTSQEYIYCRLEGKDLVVRVRLISTISSYVAERVTICKNVFDNDGLNHNLRIVFREEGIEVFQDFSFISFCPWRNPNLNTEMVVFTALEIPKNLITFCSIRNLGLDSLYDLISLKTQWYDLMIGLPQGINFNFKKVEVFQNNGIDGFNISDGLINTGNYNVDSFILDFSNTSEDANSFISTTYIEYDKALPASYSNNYDELFQETLFNSNQVLSNISLTSKSIFSSANKYYQNQIQELFSYTDIFGNFAWSKNIHKDYEYKNFNQKILNLYFNNSINVLTYQSLANFLDLVENKLEQTVKQFIPIVVNISDFGRVIDSSEFDRKKFRYINTDVQCTAGNSTTNSLVQSNLYYVPDVTNYSLGQPMVEGRNLNFTIFDSTMMTVLSINVSWSNDKITTLLNAVNNFNNINLNQYYPYIKASVVLDIIRIDLDYAWISNNLLEDANQFELIVNDGVNFKVLDFYNGIFANPSTCAIIDKVDAIPITPIQIYTYYESEQANNPVIYFNSEDQTPIYTYYSSE